VDKKYRGFIGPLILLLLIIANYREQSSLVNIRTVDFLTIWAIGALSGLLIYKVIELFKKDK
jgi:uncharacterized membrane protein